MWFVGCFLGLCGVYSVGFVFVDLFVWLSLLSLLLFIWVVTCCFVWLSLSLGTLTVGGLYFGVYCLSRLLV